jgi:threonine dehydratase
MFPLAQRYVERTVLVSDDAIRDAQKALWKTLRIVAEPGGAADMASLLSGAWKPKAGQTVGIVLCGANTTAVEFR